MSATDIATWIVGLAGAFGCFVLLGYIVGALLEERREQDSRPLDEDDDR